MYLSILSVGPSIDPKQRHVAPENPNFKDASINTEKKKRRNLNKVDMYKSECETVDGRYLAPVDG